MIKSNYIMHGLLLMVCATLMLISGCHGAEITPCNYPAIFLFGDSLSDTGNCYLTLNPFCLRVGQNPYGETVPGSPAYRFSNGRLIAPDLLASYVGLPRPLNPYLNFTANFTNGVNYAVAGATALDPVYLVGQGIVPITPFSIDTQLIWHFGLKSIVDAAATVGINQLPGKPPASAFNKALYVIEIGGNDYIDAFAASKTTTYANTTLLPLVMQKIQSTTEQLYRSGARNFLYISITPLGCSPSVLASRLAEPKDSNDCLIDINSLSYTHGVRLRQLTQSLATVYPNAKFTFLDYYGAYEAVVNNSSSYGFTKTLDTCCGTGSSYPYNYNILDFCHSNPTFLCSNPNVYLNWDGIHFTDAFNSVIANETFVSGTYLFPPTGLSTNCPN